jgi:hypothetical protein
MLVVIFRSSTSMKFLGGMLTINALLAAAAFISKFTGLAVDWRVDTGHYDQQGEFHAPGNFLISIPLAILAAFFHVYGAGPFFVSVATGGVAGLWLSSKR